MERPDLDANYYEQTSYINRDAYWETGSVVIGCDPVKLFLSIAEREANVSLAKDVSQASDPRRPSVGAEIRTRDLWAESSEDDARMDARTRPGIWASSNRRFTQFGTLSRDHARSAVPA